MPMYGECMFYYGNSLDDSFFTVLSCSCVGFIVLCIDTL